MRGLISVWNSWLMLWLLLGNKEVDCLLGLVCRRKIENYDDRVKKMIKKIRKLKENDFC